MSTYLHFYEEDERQYNRLDEELNRVSLEEVCKEMVEEDARIERLIEGRQMVVHFSEPQNVSKEWAKLFLSNWNNTVKLWNGGELFAPNAKGKYTENQMSRQLGYASICCSWLIPHGMKEPHCVAEGE